MSSRKKQSRIDTQYWVIPNPWDTLCYLCTLPDCQETHPACLIRQGKNMLKHQKDKLDRQTFVDGFKTALQMGAPEQQFGGHR